MTDRIKAPWWALLRGAFARVDYLALYRAKVVSQSGQTLDVQPDDSRIPGLSGVPILLGLPGCEVQVQPGCYVLVGWQNGDPAQPYALLWEGGASTTTITVKAQTVNLGDEGGGFVARAEKVATELSAIKSALETHTHAVSASGTAGSVTGTAAAAGALYSPNSVAASTTKAK